VGGGEIVADDEILVSNLRFLHKYWGGGNLLPMSKIPPNGSSAQAAAGIAVTDKCRHLLTCFAESPEYPP